MKIAFFDTKSYDIPGFEQYAADTDMELKFFETKLNADTVSLAAGYDAVCVFVNDTVNEEVVNRLHDLGVKAIALRCAGFNNVDIKAAAGKLRVFRVPAYSPYAVAEHAMALLL
ncbi:MAG: 2-hydroxyacid dehydrogenase, partial [Oscillospiraceae bacterium]|nr:2-hydroxyacid dehydrogenase [Oscillospiraceae bacterium]